ncbi:hypothetical protein BS50DRAFT_525419 [Corynespora cassiicola Philippines]|uniref:dihydrolipoyllysine-residue succinyltransferase n=1 Tax=Corynespora cassiicola Philippines TaxID=1448308 RepID=A0A2T2NK05_CORCC|nr:hypothetical protein BS50DRAFT_525419 [Corynespora cassiicola Philippines]
MRHNRWQYSLRPVLTSVLQLVRLAERSLNGRPGRLSRPLPARSISRFGASIPLRDKIPIIVPQTFESISRDAQVFSANKAGMYVDAVEKIATVETDQIDEEIDAPNASRIAQTFAGVGDVVAIGQIAAIGINDKASRKAPTRIFDDPHKADTWRQNAGPSSLTQSNERRAESPLEHGSPHLPSAGSRSVTHLKHEAQSLQELPCSNSRFERVETLSRMRQTIAKRLKESQDRTASLTTVQQVDMSATMEWRRRYKDEVLQRHGVKLGYMGVFTKAATLAAQSVPAINASIDTNHALVTFRDYVDVSIAVSTHRGLVTPVLRNCESMDIVAIERQIEELAKKARESKLTMDDIKGGSLTISNPGVFGSVFGTPVINHPQSAVFNMNSIRKEPVVIDGRIEIRSTMFITVTYDHRLIDEREAIAFLNTVKAYIEDPTKMLLEGGVD